MCLADLNHSTLPCQHRWYHLLRPCVPGAGLTTCPSKLALEGWEIKCDFCPFCSGWPLASGEFLLIGEGPDRHGSVSSAASSTDGWLGGGNYVAESMRWSTLSSASATTSALASNAPVGVPLSRRPSLRTSVSAARRDSKRGSVSRSDSISSNASTLYEVGPVQAAGERNRDMNTRLHRYLSDYPDRLLETSRIKPANGVAGVWPSFGNDDDVIPEIPEANMDSYEPRRDEGTPGMIGKGWKMAKRHSRDLSSFFR